MARSYHRRVSIRLVLAGVAILFWGVLGSLLSLLNALIGNSGQSMGTPIAAMTQGALFGLLIGVLVAIVALVVARQTYSRTVMLWIIGGSGVGAIGGFLLALIVTACLKGMSTNLMSTNLMSTNLMTGCTLPICTPIGAIVGSFAGGGIWRQR
jgi:hypothetical protein